MANCFWSLLMFLFLIGCRSSNKFVSFNTYVTYTQGKEQKVRYTARIPKGFTAFKIEAGGEYGTDKAFRYRDSSIIYISDYQLCDLNYENVQKAGLWSKRFTYTKISVKSICDTLTLEGIDGNGLYWKEVFRGKICIGYSKVNESNKNSFDKAIESFKCRHRLW